MRADRLLSILMLLQARGRMTADDLARELEVSVRTIYRDIDALNAAGVPLYAELGPQGGYALLDSYRTTLTGLTDLEVRALFLLAIPTQLAELGADQALRSALLKLAAALPVERKWEEAYVRQRFYMDPNWERTATTPHPHLSLLQQAIWHDRCIRMTYHPPYALPIERECDPYSLVAAGGVWYLVFGWDEQVRVQRVQDIRALQLQERTFTRRADFDLPRFWQAWRETHRRARMPYLVRMRVAPHFVSALSYYFGSEVEAALAQARPADETGWIELSLGFDSQHVARERLLNCGSGVEVLEPVALRHSLLDFAEQITAVYRRSPQEKVHHDP